MHISTLSKDHLAHIGQIVAEFAILEYQIGWGIRLLLGSDDTTGRAITSVLSFPNLVAVYSSLCRVRDLDEPTLAWLEKWIKSAYTASDSRNTIAHSVWVAGADENTAWNLKQTSKAKSGVKISVNEYSVMQFFEIISQIQEAHKQLLNLTENVASCKFRNDLDE